MVKRTRPTRSTRKATARKREGKSRGSGSRAGDGGAREWPGVEREPALADVVRRFEDKQGAAGTRRRRRGAPDAADAAPRLPTATETIRERGLRFILTARAGVTAAALLEQLRQRTDLQGWEVQPLFGNVDHTRDANAMDQMFLATLPNVSPRDLEANPFDIAYELLDAMPELLERAEPDLPENVYEPAHDPVSPLRLRGTRGGDDEPNAPEDHYWHLKLIRAEAAWQTPPMPGGASAGAGIRVGHVDTGWTHHEELDLAALERDRSSDFVDGGDSVDPLNYRGNKGHGTKTASVIISRGTIDPPSDQMVGVAPQATLVPIRAIKSVIVIFNGDVAKAIKHAVEVDCHVISMSLGGLGTGAMEAAVNYAVSKNLLVLAAAGNQVSFVVAPAKYRHCLAIAACNIRRKPWRGSAHGKAVAVTAPGENIWVAQPHGPGPADNRVGAGSGTSYAVATTAGVGALWLAHHGRDSLLAKYQGVALLQDVFRKVLQSAVQTVPGWDTNDYGPGIVDAEAVLNAPLPDMGGQRGGTRGARRGDTRPTRSATGAGGLPIQTPAEHVADLFDDVPREQAIGTLRGLIKPDTRTRGGAADDGDVNRFAPELLHILGNSPAAFRSVHAEMKRRTKRGASTTRRPTRGDTTSNRPAVDLADFASNRLARALLK